MGELKKIILFLYSIFIGVFFFFDTTQASYIDDTQSEFDLGTYADIQWDQVNSWLELDATGLSTKVGTYTSKIFDSTYSSTVWNTLSWSPHFPYNKPLPNSNATETAYSSGNFAMTSNVLLLHMDESSGNLVDSSASGGSCTASNLAYGTSGRLSSSIDLERTNSAKASCGDSTDYSFTNGSGTDLPMSICTWFNLESTQAADGQEIISKISTGAYEWQMLIAPSNRINFWAYGGGSSANYIGGRSDVNAFTSTGVWYHLCVTYSGNEASSGFKMYLNGSQINFTGSSGGTYTGMSNTAAPAVVGALNIGADPEYFDGKLDELVVFKDRVLTDSEILNMYRRGTLNLKFQVRSCDDASCVGENFVGQDGLTSNYYEESDVTSLGLPSFDISTAVSTNRYFQYRVQYVTTDSSYSPEILSITIDNTNGGDTAVPEMSDVLISLSVVFSLLFLSRKKFLEAQ